MPFKTNVALLVDGKCEKALGLKLDQTHHCFSFIKRYKNGKHVSLMSIAKECILILRVAAKLHRVLIIVIDREDRALGAQQIENQVRDLIKLEFAGEFDIVVTDIMFENWILSDIENVSLRNPELLQPTVNSQDFESSHGSYHLDRIWLKKNSSSYSSDKVSNSKKLFRYVQPNIGVVYSTSFKRFMEILNKHKILFH